LRGCRFAERCLDRMPVCDSREPALLGHSHEGLVRCFKYEDD
jgi:ABC-type dipeptide/oligopeptide/nickel transport system ATPase component